MTTKKITISLPDDVIEWIKAVAVVESISSMDVLIRAIKTEKFLTEVNKSGSKILIEDVNGNLSRLVRQ